MEERTTKYLVTLLNNNLRKDENLKVNSLIRIDSEIEKVADYSYALSKIIEEMKDNEIAFSKDAKKSLNLMFRLTTDIISKTIEYLKNEKIDLGIDIQILKEIAETKREEFRADHIQRLKSNLCNVESGISYLEILTTLEKIVDHCYNTSISLSNIITDRRFITKHDYISSIYTNNEEILKEKFNEYSLKYE